MSRERDLSEMRLRELVDGLNAGELRSTQLTTAAYRRSRKRNGHSRCLNPLRETDTVAQARIADRDIARDGQKSPLHGIPVVVSSGVVRAGSPSELGGATFEADSECVVRLREMGAIVLDATDDCTSIAGPRKTLSRDLSGSSLFEASELAAAAVAVGIDREGETRIAAACRGVVALKPTSGCGTAREAVASASPVRVSPVARTSEEVAELLSALSGKATRALAPNLSGLPIGRPGQVWLQNVVPEVREAYSSVLDSLTRLGAEVSEVSLSVPVEPPWSRPTVEPTALDDPWIAEEVDYALDRVHAILLPTPPIVPRVGAARRTGLNGERVAIRIGGLTRFTGLFNRTGHPALSLPLTSSVGPAGLQVVGRRHADAFLLALGGAFERHEVMISDRFRFSAAARARSSKRSNEEEHCGDPFKT